jgi:shikimate dehydrogenase
LAREAQVRFMDYHQIEQQASGDVLVNATPIGMYPKVEAAPVTRAGVKNYRAVVDLIYNPAQTLLLRYAQEAGLKTCNGLYMLVAQAVAAEEIWLEQKLDNQIIATVAEELARTL